MATEDNYSEFRIKDLAGHVYSDLFTMIMSAKNLDLESYERGKQNFSNDVWSIVQFIKACLKE